MRCLRQAIFFFAFTLLFTFTSTQSCQDNAPLPTSLNLLPMFNTSGELHLQGTFQVSLNNSNNITFELKQESYIRIYLAPHKVDLDIYLKNDTIVDRSVSAYREELIAVKLSVGSYTIEIRPFRSNFLPVEVTPDDEQATLEIAISPYDVVHNRVENYKHCPAGQLLPSLDFAPLAIGEPFHYSTSLTNPNRFNVRTTPGNYSWDMTYVASYNFTLSPQPGTNPVYVFTATVGYDFLTGGSLRLILTPTRTSDQVGPGCSFLTTDCVYGNNIVSNRHTLTTTLGPGNYSLWFVDAVGRKLPDIDTCTPITFDVDIEQDHRKENFVSCRAEKIPTSLLTPGLLDDFGYLYFAEEVVLDLSNTIHKTEFVLRAPSRFRMSAEAHRIDIDLEVSNSTHTLARTIQAANKEESISLDLLPNVQYTIIYHYYTSLTAEYCETFFLQIAIEPTFNDYDYCLQSQTTNPSLNLTDISGVVVHPRTQYYYQFTDSRNQAEIFKFPVAVNREREITVVIGSSVFSGLSLLLSSPNKTIYAEATTNGLKLETILEADVPYDLVLTAGSTQTNKPELTNFHRCVLYDLELSIAPIYTTTLNCSVEQFLPESLTGPAFLGTSNRVHIRDSYLVPRISGGFHSNDELKFTVRTRSLFKVHTELEGTQVGFFVNFNLSGPGLSAHPSTELYGEHIEAIVEPGVEYEFQVSFTADFSKLPRCQTWNLELVITPVDETPETNCTILEPPESFYVDYPNGFESNERYAFAQTDTLYIHRITFNVRVFSYMRALTSFDFTWGDLSLRLFANDSSLLALGRNKFNKNEIEGIQLAPGPYVLEISEPAIRSNENIRRCVDYTLSIGIAPLTPDNTLKLDAKPCKDLLFPTTFDSISYLSDISGNMMHFGNKVLLNTKDRKQSTRFTISERSYFRIFVPAFIVDIDVVLNSVEEDGTQIAEVASGRGYEEESVFAVLEPGYYKLNLLYFPHFRKGFFFPTQDDCYSYMAEVSIVPVSYASSHLLSSSGCGKPTLPTEIKKDEKTELTIVRPLEESHYRISFTILEASTVSFSLYYPYPLGGLFMNLNGSSIISPFKSTQGNKTYVGNLAQGIATIEEVLYPGYYSLNIHDPSNYSIGDYCTAFTLAYNVRTNYIPPNCCDDADHLPTDLYTTKGNSNFFGGPQNPDGSVRISGKHFLLPEKKSHSNILFQIHNTSWIRFWAKTEGETNDLDFILWRNSNKTEVIEASVGLGSVESHISLLEPQEDDYLLDVYVFDRTKDKCSYIEFELAIELNSTVTSERQCPDPIPNPALPPQTLILSKTNNVDMFSSEFMFTAPYIREHTTNYFLYSIVNYDINIVVTDGNYTIFSLVAYDFTLTDFSLSLWKDGKKIQAGDQTSTGWVNTNIDFASSITADLAIGNYTLKIEEKLYAARDQIKDRECDRFTFAFLVTKQDVDQPIPTVRYVMPPSGTALDASQSLEVSIAFSEAVGDVVPTTFFKLVEWLKQNEAVYLVDRADSTNHPNLYNAYFNFDKSKLTVLFDNLMYDKTYNLVIKAEAFQNKANVSFQAYTQQHSYSMLDCQCGGHGICSPNATHKLDCQCEFPYTGTECKSCMPGYHREANICVQNIPCTPTTCNGHGVCDDSDGYPECDCDDGYDNDGNGFCNVCRNGYAGYPNCTALPQTNLCNFPYLPLDLNTIAYLSTTGSVHVQNNYLIDTAHTSHNIKFNLEKDSYFRIYIEPHKIDIDILFYRMLEITPTNKRDRELIEYGISFHQEETMFLFLKGGNNYSLAFQFYSPGNQVGSCPTFNMELEIQPKTLFDAEIQRYNPDCSTQKLPNVPLPADKKIVNDIHYEPTDIFALKATGKNNSETIYSFNFTVKAQNNKEAYLSSELTYRFLSSDLAIKLRRTDTKEEVVGYNDYNTYYLQYSLEDGEYEFSIYLPKPQSPEVNPCIPFQFNFHLTYETAIQDIFNCDYPRLPPNFNSAVYEGGDRVHIFGQYLVEESRNTLEFTVANLSSVRVSAQSDYGRPIFVTLYRQNENTKEFDLIDRSGEDGQVIYNNLRPGLNFKISLDYGILSKFGETCRTMSLEIEIETNDMLAQEIRRITCPLGGVSKLPTIPARISTLPYSLHAPVPADNSYEEKFYYYINHLGQIAAELPFTINDNVLLEVGIATHFLTGNLDIQIHRSSGVPIISKKTLENYNYIKEILKPGNYTLKIYNFVSFPTEFVPCIPFTLDFFVTRQSVDDACSALDLDPLPKNLNLMRYMSLDKEIVIQSNKWAMPHITGLIQSQNMTFKVENTSVIRVYIQEPELDVDIHLFSEDSPHEIASGSNLRGEESFVTVIEPGKYYIRFDFFQFGVERPPCPKFDMQLAISPLVLLPTRETLCPTNLKSHFPDLPTKLQSSQLPYVDDQPTVNYHYQQVDHNEFSKPIHSWNITFTDPVDIHVEIGYNFLLGDLVLLLQDTKGSAPIYGNNEFTRNVINYQNLLPGTYTLTIYEPTANNVRVIGCSKFTFSMVVDNADGHIEKVTGFNPKLPTNLNGIAFLKYSDEVHIQNDYIVLENFNRQNTISFHLNHESFVRVTVGLQDPIQIGVDSPAVYDHPSTFKRLPAGDHSITLRLQDDRLSTAMIADTELVIVPVSQVTEKARDSTCLAKASEWKQPEIVVRPTDGFYLFEDKLAYLTSEQLKKTTDLYVIPFTLTMQSQVAVLLQYDFAVTDLVLTIRKKVSSSTPDYFGKNYYNTDEINAQLATGQYEILIRQTAAWDQDNLDRVQLTCAEFDLRITISRGNFAPCDYSSLFPWDLNLDNGGSKQFGGPMKLGAINLWHDAFLLNTEVTKLETRFHVDEKSVLSLFTYENTYTTISHRITKANATVLPNAKNQQFQQQLSLYSLESAGDYVMELSYRANTFERCPLFGIGLSILPSATLSTELSQTCSQQTHTLPTQLTLNNPIDIKSHFTSDDIRQYSDENGNFNYEINFSVSSSALLDVYLSYNSLSNFFTLNLFRKLNDNSPEEKFTSGSWSTLAFKSTTLRYTQKINTAVTEGKYRLVITQPSFNSTSTTTCFPFELSASLQGKPTGPYVTYIDPPTINGIDPQNTLYVEMRFSEQIYDKNKELITRNNIELLMANVALKDEQGNLVNPDDAIAPKTNPRPDDFTRWEFVFNHKNFVYGKTYVLTIGEIYNLNSEQIVLRNPTRYTMKEVPKDCSNRGTFNEATQKCDCNPGSHSHGNQCENCDEGFLEDSKRVCVPSACSVKEPCGCLPREKADDPCIPRGQCRESDDHTSYTCLCNTYYSGDKCEACAPGYTNYPYCNKLVEGCDPPCVNGVCNKTTSVCVCNEGYQGPTCSDSVSAPGALGTWKILGGIGAVVAALGLVGFLVWWFKYRRGPSYEEVDKLEMELDGKTFAGGEEPVELDSGDDEGGVVEGEANKFLADDSGDEL